MTKWIKRLLLVVALLLVGIIIVICIALHYLGSEPSYYRTYRWTPEQRAILNQQAADRFTAIRNLAAAAWAAEVRAGNSGTRPAQNPDASALEIALTQEQLNAFLFHNFQAQLDDMGEQCGIFLKDGRIVLSAQPRELNLGYLLSAQLRVSLLNDGRLLLDMEKVLAGRLPLPQTLVESQTSRVRDALRRRMAEWQRTAAMDPQGACNPAFVQTAFALMLLASLEHRPGLPVIFMPGERGKALPLRLTNVRIEEGTISLTVRPMQPPERAELWRTVTERPQATLSPQTPPEAGNQPKNAH